MTKSKLYVQLMSILANSYALYLKTQNYHWNVTGANFSSLHAMFEVQYKDLAEAVDEIAERIRTLGHKVPASLAEFSKLAAIQDGKEKSSSTEMLADICKDQHIIVTHLKEALHEAEQATDNVTMDLLVSRIAVHEKNAWMLKSTSAD